MSPKKRRAPFLSPSQGEAGLQLLRMVRPEFVNELRTAIHRCRKQEAPVRKEGIVIKRNAALHAVALEVVPMHGADRERYFLVLFEETGATEAVPRRVPSKTGRVAAHTLEITRLERELQTSKEYLQAIIEEHEATNEELKSAGEEAPSGNEELQSTNEELETAKEELQSTNEESDDRQ